MFAMMQDCLEGFIEKQKIQKHVRLTDDSTFFESLTA